jgi:hypothetical protein
LPHRGVRGQRFETPVGLPLGHQYFLAISYDI